VNPQARLVRGIDVSNYQPADLTELIHRYQAEHIVVRLSTESQRHREIAITQLHSAVANGCTVSGYIWCYWDLDAAAHISAALDVADEAGVPLVMVWLDAEDTESANHQRIVTWLHEATVLVEQRGQRCGIYTARWFWDSYVRSEEFAHLPLWAAQYDNEPTLESVQLFGGWSREMLRGKQYSADEIDLNVFSELVARGGGL